VTAVAVLVPAEQARRLKRMTWIDVETEALYDANDAAVILGLAHRDSMYTIPTGRLPQYRLGPKGGLVRWLGRDLLAYRESCRREG
jgi:hypothetical protein